MSFDPRSLERLRELGRQLPKPLPDPEGPVTPKARQVKHKVETEQNPEQLFRELMQVSEDGTVPEHLMARLKMLEGQRSSSSTPVAGALDVDSPLPPLPAFFCPTPPFSPTWSSYVSQRPTSSTSTTH